MLQYTATHNGKTVFFVLWQVFHLQFQQVVFQFYGYTLTFGFGQVETIILAKIGKACFGVLVGGRQRKRAASHILGLYGHVRHAVYTDGAVDAHRFAKLIDGLESNMILGVLYQVATFRKEGNLKIGFLLFR